MKPALITAFMLLMITFANTSNAQKSVRAKIISNPLTVEVSIADSSLPKYLVKVVNPSGLGVDLEIKDERGSQLSQTSSRQQRFSQFVDFSQAVDGNYVLTITDGISTIRKNIPVKTNVVTVRALGVE